MGLKTPVLGQFWVLMKGIPTLDIGLSPQICTDLRRVKNPWKFAYMRKKIHPVY